MVEFPPPRKEREKNQLSFLPALIMSHDIRSKVFWWTWGRSKPPFGSFSSPQIDKKLREA